MKRKGFCVQKRGDWAWLKQLLNLQGWATRGRLTKTCFRCAADRDGVLPMTDATLWADWRTTLIDAEAYVLNQFLSGRYVSKFWSLPGMKYKYLSLDLMHVSDIGILQYLLGNVLWEMFLKLGGVVGTPSRALGLIVTNVKLACRNIGLEDRGLGLVPHAASLER